MEDKLLNEEHAAAQTAENYRRVCDEIAEAAYKAGRDPSEIRLVGSNKIQNLRGDTACAQGRACGGRRKSRAGISR